MFQTLIDVRFCFGDVVVLSVTYCFRSVRAVCCGAIGVSVPVVCL